MVGKGPRAGHFCLCECVRQRAGEGKIAAAINIPIGEAGHHEAELDYIVFK